MKKPALAGEGPRVAQGAKVGGLNLLAPTLFYTYIIHSRRLGRFYVGSTMNIANRLREHNAGRSLSTRAGIPWTLVHLETFATRSEAVQHEAQIKARGIRRYLDDIHVAFAG